MGLVLLSHALLLLACLQRVCSKSCWSISTPGFTRLSVLRSKASKALKFYRSKASKALRFYIAWSVLRCAEGSLQELCDVEQTLVVYDML
jgi:hypothetical protein